MRIAAALMLGLAIPAAQAQSDFTERESAAVLSHGPWPPAPRRDPANRVSGKPQAIALGERLFFEPRLSGTGSVLCATCHVPFRRFQDGRAVGFGLEPLERNTPTLVNVAAYRSYGLDGARDSLPAQSIRPLLEAREMRSSAAHVAATIRKLFPGEYRAAFDRAPPADDEEVLLDAGRALAAFQETLVSRRTPFDEFRDALAKGDATGMRRYPLAAQRGLRLFVGKAACSACHAGPHFTRAAIDADEARQPGWRVPGLRNVALTAPYLHDGSVADLREAAKHSPAKVSPAEADELVAFLRSLTEPAEQR